MVEPVLSGTRGHEEDTAGNAYVLIEGAGHQGTQRKHGPCLWDQEGPLESSPKWVLSEV